MSIIRVEAGTFLPNFLDSEVGLVLKTAQIPQEMGEEDGGSLMVLAGTIFPADDDSATGIVYQNADVTGGDAIGSVMVAGRVIRDRLSVSAEAEDALTAQGFVFVEALETVRA